MKHAQDMLDHLWQMGFRPTIAREASEGEVVAALVDAHIVLPITTPVEVLAVCNVVLDQLTGDFTRIQGADAARVLRARLTRAN